jgi:hypothetical protein
MNDRTAEIFDWLKITPVTHKELFEYCFALPHEPLGVAYQPIPLLSDTLEADGLAGRLWQLMQEKLNNEQVEDDDNYIIRVINAEPFGGEMWEVEIYDAEGEKPPFQQEGYVVVIRKSLAHAIHDALCAAMDAERESNATNQ